MASDPEAVARNVEAILGRIDQKMQSIAGHASAAQSAFGGVGAGGGGGGGSSRSRLGLASIPRPAGGTIGGTGGVGGGAAPPAGGGGSRPGAGAAGGGLGLARVVGGAGYSAATGLVRGFSSDRVGSAAANDILATQFSLADRNTQTAAQLSAAKSKWTYGKGLGGFNGYDRADDSAAAAGLATLYNPSTDPNSLYQQQKNKIGQSSLRHPGISAASLVGFQGNTAAPGTYNTLRRAGINAVDANGNGADPDQLAKQFLGRISKQNRNPNSIRRLLMTGGSIDSWLNASGIQGDQREALTQSLMAQVSGNPGLYGNTIDASTKKRAESTNQRQLSTDEGVVKGAESLDKAAIKLNQAADSILQNNKALADTIGRGEGGAGKTGGSWAGRALGWISGGLESLNPAHLFGGGGGSPQDLINQATQGSGGPTPGSVPGMSGGANSSARATSSPVGGGGFGGAAKTQSKGAGSEASVTGVVQAGAAGAKSGEETASMRRVWPVGPGNTSQTFNNPAGHAGVDFFRPEGTPIHAAADGVVTFAGPARDFGNNFVAIYHKQENKSTHYGHGSAKFVSVGDHVKAGDVIANVGNQGLSFGAHLHFELQNGQSNFGNVGNSLDPLPWLGGAATSNSKTRAGTDQSNSNSQGVAGADDASGRATASSNSILTSIASLVTEGKTSSLLGGSRPAGAKPTKKVESGSSSGTGTGTDTGGGGGGAAGNKIPDKYKKLVAAAAAKYNTPGNLIAAEIMGESTWNLMSGDDTNDGANSFGLGQFIPATASTYPEYKVGDAAGQINGVSHFLRDLYNQHGHSWIQASRYYNHGNPGYWDYIRQFLDPQSLPGVKNIKGTDKIDAYAKGTWELERDKVAQIHKGEMIIPAGPAEAIRQASKNGSGGGNVTIHVHLRDASNAEAMRLVQTVKQHLGQNELLNALKAT